MTDVKFIRLMTGDDVISEVVEVGDENQIDYMLICPLKVVYIPSTRGVSYLQVAFMPWVFSRICDTQEFLIHAEDVLTMADVSQQIEEYYWKNLDMFVQNGEKENQVVGEELEENEHLEELEEILEALKDSKRTLH